jgi:Na+/melibiose symporter-like transporter
MFSVALTRARLNASLAFGIWAFAGKLGLALAAFLVMPVLEWNGFNPSQSNDAQALGALTAAYAIVPCCLKLIAWFLVARLPGDETAG